MKLGLVSALLLVVVCTTTVFAQPLPEASPESVGISSEGLDRLAEVIEREIREDRMPGAVVAIARRGKLVYYESFGYLDKAAGMRMPKDAIFSIASMTKPIFAAGAMTLYAEARLVMNEPVGSYLPELADREVAVDDAGKVTESAIRQPTIEDLMRHTSGFVTRGRGDTALHERYPASQAASQVVDRVSEQDYLSRFAELPLRYQPGTTWEYGPGLDLLGLAIERITDQSIHEFLTERIFSPLGMSDTVFTLSAKQAERKAQVLPIAPMTGEPQETRDQTEPWLFNCGGGCLASTALDYLAFAQMLLDGGTLNGVRVLSPSTVEYMISDHIGPDIDMTRLYQMSRVPAYGYGYGLGGAVRREAGLGGRTGSPGEYMWVGSQGTLFWIDPRKELVVVYMAQTPGEIGGYYRQIIPNLIYEALLD